MQEIILANAVSVQDGQPATTSIKVAEVFGKKPKDINKAILRLIEQDERCKRNFAPTSFPVQMPNGGYRAEVAYVMNRDGFTLLAMSFTGKTALSFKLAYIEAFNRMEEEIAKQSFKDEARRFLDSLLTDFQYQVDLALDAMLGERPRLPNGFIAPTVEDVKQFCEAEGLTHVDPVKFVKYYAARNWTTGTNAKPMDDWRKTAENWERYNTSPKHSRRTTATSNRRTH